jgi:NADPH:quinone reductase-like Zn-dependent oxidoreductase
MKAAFIERYGGPEVFQYGDFPDPIFGPGEIVIDIVATSVNAADWKVCLPAAVSISGKRDFEARE